MSTRAWLGWSASLVLLAVFTAPLLPGVYFAFAPVCHQQAARCFEWLGRPLPVCARCLGLYAGALAAALRPARATPAWLWLFAAANVADWVLGLTGNAARFALALPLGWLGASTLIRLAAFARPLGH